jgi:outer membrane protein OmpA-like peptidoglycan-associated protein
MRDFHRSFLILALSLAAGCSKQAQISTTPEPAPAPMPEATPAAAEEPETEPVVKEEPKNLDIQANVIRLKPGIRILFATDSDKLLDASFPILDEVASVLDQNQKIRVRVEGHTDADGKADHNQDLSTRRAASVRAYLIGKGVTEDRLESTGCGQTVPVADNKTEDGKAQNRRVEFVILRKRRQVEACQVYKPREHHRRDRQQQDGAQPADPAATPAPAPAPAPTN